jgi:hypothetical protein
MPDPMDDTRMPMRDAAAGAVATVHMDWSELGEFAREHAMRPMLSLYIDGHGRDPAERRGWRRLVDDEIDAIARLVQGSDAAERERFSHAAERVCQRLDAVLPGAIGHPALAVFATAEGVLRMDVLPVGGGTSATWGAGPRIAPYACAIGLAQSALVLLVSHREVRLARVRGTRSDAIGVLDAALVKDDPLAHTRGRRVRRLRAAVRGGTTTDVSPPRRAVTFERMLGVLAEAVVTATGPDDLVVVGGCPEAAREAAAWLDARTPRDVVLEDALGEQASEADVRAAAARATLRWRGQRNADRLGELTELGQASRRHAIGIMAVASALEHGAVRELVLSRGFLDEEAALADDLVAITLQQSGSVVTLEGDAAAHLDEEGGVAALLRFIPIPSAYGVGWESSGTAA